MPNPRRGEIWQIRFDLARGAEIRKQRPAVVLSSDQLGVLPIKLVVPLTGWVDSYAGKAWIVRIEPSKESGLTKVSAAETLQTRTVSLQRFVAKVGELDNETLQEIAAALAILVELE
jgi:mRNA interferase MazF